MATLSVSPVGEVLSLDWVSPLVFSLLLQLAVGHSHPSRRKEGTLSTSFSLLPSGLHGQTLVFSELRDKNSCFIVQDPESENKSVINQKRPDGYEVQVFFVAFGQTWMHVLLLPRCDWGVYKIVSLFFL